MTSSSVKNSEAITKVLNGTIATIKSIIPIEYDLVSPQLTNDIIQLHYGVLIGITGDIEGKLMFAGNSSVFSSVGEKMYGMPLEGDMLTSFSGELGNMIAGGLSTSIAQDGTFLDITPPTVMTEETTITGYQRIVKLPIKFKNTGNMDTYLFLK